MAYNGSGTFVRLYDWEDDRDADILIRADRMDAEMDGMATGLSTAICKDGQTTITANLPMATYRHTGVGNASARTHYAAYGQVQDSSAIWGGTAGGTANALTVTMTPTVTTLATGQIIWLKAASTNTSSSVTLTVDAVAAKNVYGHAGAAATPGDIIAGNIYGFAYDGTQFILLNPTPKGAWVQIGTASASNNATIDLAIPAGFDEYEVALYNIVPATDAVNLRMRTSTDGGSTFDSGANDYGTGNDHFQIVSSVGSDTNENGVSGNVKLFRPGTAQHCQLLAVYIFRQSDGTISSGVTEKTRDAVADVDYVRFYFSSGNVESGEFRVLARRK